MKEDPGFYDYWPYENRPRITWPGGARLAFWVAPNIEFYELDPPPNPQRKAWPQPYPAVPGYSIRDYGNRVGHARQMAVLDRYGIRGSISLSTALCDHHPEIIAQCAERNWEFFSHGIYNTRYSYGMDEAQERMISEDSGWESDTFSFDQHLGPAMAKVRAAVSDGQVDALLDDIDGRVASSVLRAALFSAARDVAGVDHRLDESEQSLLAQVAARFR